MALSCGIVGLPNVGQATLCNAFTSRHADRTVHPFSSVEVNGAAGKIHSDFEEGSIRAEVYSVEHLVAPGSAAALQAAGRQRDEERDCVMRPSDVVHFLVKR